MVEEKAKLECQRRGCHIPVKKSVKMWGVFGVTGLIKVAYSKSMTVTDIGFTVRPITVTWEE